MSKAQSDHLNKKKKNQIVKAHCLLDKAQNSVLMDYLNRVITTQAHLMKANFDLPDFSMLIISQLQKLTKANGVAIGLVEEDKLIYQVVSGSMKKFADLSFDINEGMSTLSINTQQIIRFDDAKKDERLNSQSLERIASLDALITAPFFYQGQPVGFIEIASHKKNPFNDIAVQALSLMASLMGQAVTKVRSEARIKVLLNAHERVANNLKRTEKKLKRVAHHDYLTGLPNRNLFTEQLEIVIKKARRQKQLVALMYMDIDHFKKINETLGNAVGDKLLLAFAMRLKQCVRSSDVIARVGSDEFVLLLDDIKEPQDVIVIADKVLHAMRKPFNFNKNIMNVTTSIGISFLSDTVNTPDDFINQADQALYISKNTGRNNFYIYNNELLHEEEIPK